MTICYVKELDYKEKEFSEKLENSGKITPTLPPIRDPSKTNFKKGDMGLFRNHNPKDTFDSNYEPSFTNCKKSSDMAFDFQDNLDKIIRVSIQHVQPLYPQNTC